jgi:hypothetical protein
MSRIGASSTGRTGDPSVHYTVLDIYTVYRKQVCFSLLLNCQERRGKLRSCCLSHNYEWVFLSCRETDLCILCCFSPSWQRVAWVIRDFSRCYVNQILKFPHNFILYFTTLPISDYFSNLSMWMRTCKSNEAAVAMLCTQQALVSNYCSFLVSCLQRKTFVSQNISCIMLS